MTETSHLRSRIAHAAADELVVHGVAIGEDDLTRGKHGPKRWPREVLEPAAATLEGQTVFHNYGDPEEHDGDGREDVGEVVRAAYDPGVGVVYEARLEDEELAERLSRGELEVSIEGTAPPESVEVDAETGAAVLHDFEFTGMAVVLRGASPSNYTAPGEADTNPGIAALSAGDIQTALQPDDDADTDSDADTEETAASAGAGPGAATDDNPPDDPDAGEVVGDRVSESTPEDTEPMSDDDSGADDGPTTEELKAELGELREELAEVREERDALADENEQLADVADQAALEYAAALTDEDDPFTPEELADRYEVAELAAKYEDATDVALTDDDAEPDVQSGDADPDEEEAVLAADRERIEEIDTKLSMLRHTLPEHRKEELRAEACELAGVDDYDAALEVL